MTDLGQPRPLSQWFSPWKEGTPVLSILQLLLGGNAEEVNFGAPEAQSKN